MNATRIRPRSGQRVAVVVAFLTGLAALMMATPAFAVPEPAPTLRNCGGCHEVYGYPCERCHDYPYNTADAANSAVWFGGTNARSGPHGNYSATSTHCEKCHTLHDASTSFKLLPGTTVKATCFTCHDGTGGEGVYGTIKVRTGTDPAGGHMIETTNVVPGGDATSGGSTTVVFRGPSGNLTCSDCHSPHDSNTVANFGGERIRVAAGMEVPPAPYSNRLLKKRPTGATADVAEYGSDWCLACHRGRSSGGAVHNHPVDSGAGAFVYERIPVNRTNNWDFVTDNTLVRANLGNVMGSLGYVHPWSARHFEDSQYPAGGTDNWFSAGWLMPYPRSALQTGHGPICQQCHEDSREAGELRNNGTEVWMQSEVVRGANADGRATGAPFANPLFQNFPHETQNANLLLETGDDLCLNCHPAEVLP